MRQPFGFIDPRFPSHMCYLKKAIYGLKQAPRAWFHRFSSFLLTHEFICSQSDLSMFIYHHNIHIIILPLYADDIILTGCSISLLSSFISTLSTQFAMKDFGLLHYFLGV